MPFFCKFSAFYALQNIFLTTGTGLDGIHKGVEIGAEREGVAQGVIVLRIFAVIVRENKESQAVVIEREDRGYARQIFHTEMAEDNA